MCGSRHWLSYTVLWRLQVWIIATINAVVRSVNSNNEIYWLFALQRSLSSMQVLEMDVLGGGGGGGGGYSSRLVAFFGWCADLMD